MTPGMAVKGTVMMMMRGTQSKRVAARCGERGLSLIEVMVVLAIIGLVAVIATPQIINYFERAKVDTAQIQVRALSSNVDLYRMDTGRYPTAEQGLQALVAPPPDETRWRGPYIKSASSLIDPWGNPYLYRAAPNGAQGVVMSLGADGIEGGDGFAADIAE